MRAMLSFVLIALAAFLLIGQANTGQSQPAATATPDPTAVMATVQAQVTAEAEVYRQELEQELEIAKAEIRPVRGSGVIGRLVGAILPHALLSTGIFAVVLLFISLESD